eukprot:9415913-Karenia_brevis.AAC.1
MLCATTLLLLEHTSSHACNSDAINIEEGGWREQATYASAQHVLPCHEARLYSRAREIKILV